MTHKLWPEDPLGPPLTEAELDRLISAPELRKELGLPELTPEERRDFARRKFDQQLVTCQRCKRTMPMANTPDHDCGYFL